MASQSKHIDDDARTRQKHVRLQHLMRQLHPQQQEVIFVSHATTNNSAESMPTTTTSNNSNAPPPPHTSVTTDTWNNVLGLLLLSQLVPASKLQSIFRHAMMDEQAPSRYSQTKVSALFTLFQVLHSGGFFVGDRTCKYVGIKNSTLLGTMLVTLGFACSGLVATFLPQSPSLTFLFPSYTSLIALGSGIMDRAALISMVENFSSDQERLMIAAYLLLSSLSSLWLSPFTTYLMERMGLGFTLLVFAAFAAFSIPVLSMTQVREVYGLKSNPIPNSNKQQQQHAEATLGKSPSKSKFVSNNIIYILGLVALFTGKTMLQYQSASALVNCIDLSPLNASIISALGSTTSILSRIGLFDWESNNNNNTTTTSSDEAAATTSTKRMVHDRFTYLLLIQSGLSFLLAVAPAIINWLSQLLSNSNKLQQQQQTIEFKRRYQILYAAMMTCLFSVHALILPLMRQMNEIVPQQYKAWLVRVQSYAPMLGSMMTTLFSLMTELGQAASQAKHTAAATMASNNSAKKIATTTNNNNNNMPTKSTAPSFTPGKSVSSSATPQQQGQKQQSKPTPLATNAAKPKTTTPSSTTTTTTTTTTPTPTTPSPSSSSPHQYATFYQSSFYMLSIWSACIALVTKLLK